MSKNKKGRLTPADVQFTEDEVSKFLNSHSNLELGEYAKAHPLCPNILSSDGQGMFFTNSICAIKSQVGQGKSKSVRLLSAAALGGAHDLGLDAAPGKVVVRIFDTEMPWGLVSDTYKIVDRMAPIPRKDDSYFGVTTFMPRDGERPMTPLEKESMIMSIITADCTAMFGSDTRLLYFVDGVAQLVDDPNDMDECKPFVERWLAFVSSKPVCVCFIIHENQGKQGESGKMTGHLGSYIMKQAGEVYRTARQGDIFTISNSSADCKYRYGAKLPDVNFSIQGSFEDEVYVSADSPQAAANEKKAATRRGLLESNFKNAFAFCNTSLLTYTRLKTAYTAVTKSSDRTSTRAIKDAWNLGILKQDKDGYYSLGSVIVSSGVK